VTHLPCPGPIRSPAYRSFRSQGQKVLLNRFGEDAIGEHLVNALSNLWRDSRIDSGGHRRTPRRSVFRRKHFRSAIRTGLRYCGPNNPHLRRDSCALGRLLHFCQRLTGASSGWSPRNQIQGGPQLTAFCLALGAGAVGGASPCQGSQIFRADKLVAAGYAGTAARLVSFWPRRDPATAFIASIVAGLSWIAVLAGRSMYPRRCICRPGFGDRGLPSSPYPVRPQ